MVDPDCMSSRYTVTVLYLLVEVSQIDPSWWTLIVCRPGTLLMFCIYLRKLVGSILHGGP